MLSAMFLQLINHTAALFEQPLSGAVHPGHSQLVFLLTGVGVLMPHAWLDIPRMEYRFLERGLRGTGTLCLEVQRGSRY